MGFSLGSSTRLTLPSRACTSMRRQFIPDHLAVLHHEANALELGYVGDRISATATRSANFPGLMAPMWSCLPNNFCRAGCEGANHMERWLSGITQINVGRSAGLPTRLSAIEPAYIRSTNSTTVDVYPTTIDVAKSKRFFRTPQPAVGVGLWEGRGTACLCGDYRLARKQQAVCATVPKTPQRKTAPKTMVSSTLAAR